MIDDLIIRWTARLAVACYFARLCCDATDGTSEPLRRSARGWWTIGCGLFVCHVVAAFQLEHHWSHQAAYDSTAKRTLEMTGWDSGIGLYVNYAFLALWIIDTSLWWRDLSWTDHQARYWAVQSVFAFMIIQSTAVFGPPLWKPVVLAAVLYLLFLCCRYRRQLRRKMAHADA